MIVRLSEVVNAPRGNTKCHGHADNVTVHHATTLALVRLVVELENCPEFYKYEYQ